MKSEKQIRYLLQLKENDLLRVSAGNPTIRAQVEEVIRILKWILDEEEVQ